MFLLLLNFRQNYKAAENIKKEKIENKDRERENKKRKIRFLSRNHSKD